MTKVPADQLGHFGSVCVRVRKKECVSACVQQYVDLAVSFPLFQSLHNAEHSRKM